MSLCSVCPTFAVHNSIDLVPISLEQFLLMYWLYNIEAFRKVMLGVGRRDEFPIMTLTVNAPSQSGNLHP